jgi:hypothetical protein
MRKILPYRFRFYWNRTRNTLGFLGLRPIAPIRRKLNIARFESKPGWTTEYRFWSYTYGVEIGLLWGVLTIDWVYDYRPMVSSNAPDDDWD